MKEMDKLFRRVSVKDRDPEKYGYYDTAVGNIEYSPNNGWQWGMPNPDYWLEEITLENIQDKRELTATFLVNSIRLLDEQGARHLVKELCERFHLLPSEEDIEALANQYEDNMPFSTTSDGFEAGANYILKKLKGEKK